MPLAVPQSAEAVHQAFSSYGATPGGKAMMRAEARAAEEALASRVYITWRSTLSGADCARVGSGSRCFCGHSMAEHAPVDRGNPRSPRCLACACKALEFVPSRPEEVGMWWLPRRKGFVVSAWRAPCKCQHGHDVHDVRTRGCRSCGCRHFDSAYQCIGCDGKQEAHETVLELEAERVQAGRSVGRAFMPLADCPELQTQLFASMKLTDGTASSRGAAGSSALTLEQKLERGEISVAEYQQRILSEPPPDSHAARPAAGSQVSRRAHQETPPPTVTELRVTDSKGQEVTLLTNAGPPVPRPGHDWSRPWEPGDLHPAAAARRSRPRDPR